TSLEARDANYTRESILVPTAKIVQGYPGNMPSFQGSLSEAQLEGLIAYYQSLSDRGPVQELEGEGAEGEAEGEAAEREVAAETDAAGETADPAPGETSDDDQMGDATTAPEGA
ncbi:MAG: hypothetical protein AAFP26_07870, partial [Planctomycetota bacterium]